MVDINNFIPYESVLIISHHDVYIFFKIDIFKNVKTMGRNNFSRHISVNFQPFFYHKCK